MQDFINIAYIVASILFVLGIKMLGNASTARRGNFLSLVVWRFLDGNHEGFALLCGKISINPRPCETANQRYQHNGGCRVPRRPIGAWFEPVQKLGHGSGPIFTTESQRLRQCPVLTAVEALYRRWL